MSKDTTPTPLPKKRAIILLRFTFIIAAAYMLIAELGLTAGSAPLGLFLAVGLVSNLLLFWVPERLFDAMALPAALIVADTVGLTAVFLFFGQFTAEFFYVYFFILFLAAIGENLALIALGAGVASVAYLYALSTSGGFSSIWSTSLLLRLPFFLMVATFYGYLADRLRRERLHGEEEARVNVRLKEVHERLEERARQLQETSHKLELANEKLRELNQLKSDFVSVVSHELRTPLTAIKNAAGLLASGSAGEVSETQQRFLGMVSRNTQRLMMIVNDLLDLSKIEAGKFQYRFSEVNLAELLTQVCEALADEAASRGLTLEQDCPEQLPAVWADPQRIDQVIWNLMGNAMKFTPQGGRVTLAARSRGEEVEIAVADTGVGIASEDQAAIFDSFYQVEDPMTRKSTGTGLGLAIIRGLLAAHGATISVESEVGRGSRFSFRLPVVSARAVAMSALDSNLPIHQARAEGFSLLVLALEPRPGGELGGPGDVEESLRRLDEFVASRLPRSSDHQVAQGEFRRLVVVLGATPKAGAALVKERLGGALAKAASEGSVPPVTILGPVTFPEDGTSGTELIARAVSAERG